MPILCNKFISITTCLLEVFTRFASEAADEEGFTKLSLRFRNFLEGDLSLVVQCFTYETLAPQADVRVVQTQ
jgi:hypothetical protein